MNVSSRVFVRTRQKRPRIDHKYWTDNQGLFERPTAYQTNESFNLFSQAWMLAAYASEALLPLPEEKNKKQTLSVKQFLTFVYCTYEK